MSPPKITECIVEGEPLRIINPDPSSGYSIAFIHDDSMESAKEGFRLCLIDESKVAELSEMVNHYDKGNRAITLEDLKSIQNEKT